MMFKNDNDKKYIIADIVFLVTLFTFGRYYIFDEFLSKKSYLGLVMVFIAVYILRFFSDPVMNMLRNLMIKDGKLQDIIQKKV